jgi:hypothetical protein
VAIVFEPAAAPKEDDGSKECGYISGEVDPNKA